MAAYYVPPYASLWLRAAAYMIDLLIIFMFWGFYSYAAFGSGGRDTTMSLLTFSLVNFVYFTAFTVAFHATPGKMGLRLKIAMLDGASPEPPAMLLRYAVLFVTQLVPFGVVVSGVFASTTPDRRAIHDCIAGTVVVRSR